MQIGEAGRDSTMSGKRAWDSLHGLKHVRAQASANYRGRCLRQPARLQTAPTTLGPGQPARLQTAPTTLGPGQPARLQTAPTALSPGQPARLQTAPTALSPSRPSYSCCKIRFRYASTVARKSGGTTVVALNSVIIAGPSISFPGCSASRR